MNIKKFQGKNEDEAIKLAKKELGENVVVLNSKTIKSKGIFAIFKRPVVEITVATQGPEDTQSIRKSDIENAISSVNKVRTMAENTVKEEAKPVIKDDSKVVAQKLENIQTLLEEKLKKADSVPAESKTTDSSVVKDNVNMPEVKEESDNAELIDFIKLLYNTMVDNEIREQFANQMIDGIEQNYSKDAGMEYILSHIYQKMILKFGKNDTITPAAKGPKVIYFIGPTGVGKTTTLAKIASKLYLGESKKIAMFTIDTYRIAASDQLNSYANIMDVPMEIILEPEKMVSLYEKYNDYDYILIDTAGHSSKNKEMSENTNNFLHCLDDIAEKEVYLVMSATTKYKDLVNIADYYKEMADYKLIFTKLDETASYGNLLNIKLYTGAAMSYVTCGQNVPDDIDCFDAQDTVRKLLISENN